MERDTLPSHLSYSLTCLSSGPAFANHISLHHDSVGLLGSSSSFSVVSPMPISTSGISAQVSYNAVHPYTYSVPIGCYLVLRNLLPEFRKRYLNLFAYTGKYTLETYIFNSTSEWRPPVVRACRSFSSILCLGGFLLTLSS